MDNFLTSTRVGQYQGKFLAAIAADYVASTEMVGERFGEHFQDQVSSVVPEGIVESLEVVDIYKHHGKGTICAARAQQFAFERLLHETPIVKAG
jgi:hypothetical protein